jgi:hypothetical protein
VIDIANQKKDVKQEDEQPVGLYIEKDDDVLDELNAITMVNITYEMYFKNP